MPNIREYVSQVSAESGLPSREARSTDFGGQGVEALGQAVSSVGASISIMERVAQQNKARQEVTDVDISASKLGAELTVQLNERAKKWKPGDGDLAEAFGSEVKYRLDALGVGPDGSDRFETAVGQQRFNEKAAHIASQFVVEASRVQSQLYGAQAEQAHHELIDTNANFLQTHPAYFNSVMGDIKDAIMNPDGIYGRISEANRAKLLRLSEEALAVAAVQGTIRNTPLVALDKLQHGWMNQQVPNDKLPVLMHQAETAVKALQIDSDRAHKEAEWARTETARKIENSLFTKLGAHDADPSKNPPLTAQDVLDSQLGVYDADKQGSILATIHQRSRERMAPQVTDPGVMRKLFDRIHLPPGDPRKITDETALNNAYAVQEKLSFEDLGRLRKELADGRTPDGAKLGAEKKTFIDGMQSSITKSNQLLGKLDADGDVNLYKFGYMVDKKIQEYEKAGKDPHDLFDPEKPDFLGTPARLKPFQKTMQESIKSISKKFQDADSKLPETLPEEQKRKPGESYGDWKARQK